MEEKGTGNSAGTEVAHWLSDELVNMMKNLLCSLRKERKTFLFSTLTTTKEYEVYSRTGNLAGASEVEKMEAKITSLVRGQTKLRRGQLLTFHESEFAFAPCHVNGNHWIGFRINKSTGEVQ